MGTSAAGNWVCLARLVRPEPGPPVPGANWVCFASFGRLAPDPPGRAKLGLFVQPDCVPPGTANQLALSVQLSPAPPGELALFGTIGVGLEWWNDGILEQWGSRSPPRLELGLFGTTGSSHDPACPLGGGKLGLFVRRALSRSGGIGFVCTTGPRRPEAAGRTGRPAKLGLFVLDSRRRSPHAPVLPSLALFRTIAATAQIGFVSRARYRDASAVAAAGIGDSAWHASSRFFRPLSNHKS